LSTHPKIIVRTSDFHRTPKHSLVRAVLFDLDGTLIDSAPDLGAAADKMRVDRGMSSLPYELYRPMAGAGARGMLGVAFGMEPDHPQFNLYRTEFFSNYEDCLTKRTQAFSGISELLGSLRLRGIRWGIVTNKSARFTEPLVQQLDVLREAVVVISGDTTPHAKPHPEPIFEATRRLKLEPFQCVYVGDDKRDIDAGRAAGMCALAATWGYMGDHDVNTWGADAPLKEPDCLLDWLDGRL
jgi:N-acetyl-D-muramate 6-phosphate phosphatase